MFDKLATPDQNEMGNLLGVTQALARELKQKGNGLVHERQVDYMIALESANPLSGTEINDIRTNHGKLEKVLKDMFQTKGLVQNMEPNQPVSHKHPRWKQEFTAAQWKAGAVVLGAMGAEGQNAVAYMRKAAAALESFTPQAGVADFNLFQSSPDFGYVASNPALESFDARQLEAFIPVSAVYNVQAARQEEACEALYPTVVLTPDQTGLEISVRRVMVHNEIRHSQTGKVTDFNRVNLMNAIRDHRILGNDTTTAVPIWVQGDTENNACFSADVPAYDIELQGVTKKTAPLMPGIEVDLLGLANLAQVQPNGTLDQWDSLDLRLTLDAIYLKIVDSDDNESVVKIVTKRLPMTGYFRSFEGLENDVNLAFLSKTIPLTGTTKDITNVNAEALDYLRGGPRTDWVVQLGVQMNGRGNLEFGRVSATPANITIEAVLDKQSDGTYAKVTDPAAIAAVKADLASITVVGYDLGAFRSNLNRRSLGIITTTVAQRERHIVPLHPPIMCASPLTATVTNTDIAAPIVATRIRNSNNAITKLFEYDAQLASLAQAYDQRLAIPQIEGIGANLVKPYHSYRPVDVFAIVNSQKSQDRAADVSAALINVIRDEAYRAYMNSNYQPALNAETGNLTETPQLIIVTDPVTMRHLLVSGDTRTASIGFDFQILESQDLRMVNQIFITFARKGQTGIDPLSFGFMAWIPELATNLPITRNGGTTQEIQVQARTLHVNTLPILIHIEVDNLSKAVSDNVPLPFKDVT